MRRPATVSRMTIRSPFGSLCRGGRFVITLLVLATALHRAQTLEGQQPGTRDAARYNIVVVITDDHGQDTGAYGNPVLRTPNLDALAAEGTLFTHAFATTASCSASRSVVLTGLHNHRTAQYGHEHDYSHFRSYDDLRPRQVGLAPD